MTKQWKITSTGTRCQGHGDYTPEATISLEGGMIDIRVGGYYATKEQVDAAASELCALLNSVLPKEEKE